MLVFVSTERTQGQMRHDCCSVPEGELVVSPSDGGPYLIGSKCFTATTSFAVADLGMSSEEYVRAILDCQVRQMGGLLEAGDAAELLAEATREASDLAASAAFFEPGSVVGATATKYVLREGPA